MQPISDRGGMDPGGIPAGVHMDSLLFLLATNCRLSANSSLLPIRFEISNSNCLGLLNIVTYLRTLVTAV
jgi:hypothetical protein